RGNDLDSTASVSGSTPRRGFVGTITSPTTGTGVNAFFTLDTKQGEVTINFPDDLESITKRPSQDPGIPVEGDRVAVLVALVALVGEDPTNEALKIIVKPTTPRGHSQGAVVSITTGENGIRTMGIMRPNGKIKEFQLGPDADVPEVGDLVTVLQGRGRGSNGAGANGAPFATGIVRADAVRVRLQGFLDDLTTDTGDLPPEAAEGQARRIANIAAILEDHAAKHLEIIQTASENPNLPQKAKDAMMKGLAKAQLSFNTANEKSTEAKDKANDLRPVRGESQGGRGNSGR
ncbi:MAG: hypothetical protein V3S68_07570, partial [Dehalococcoidia bacterium]